MPTASQVYTPDMWAALEAVQEKSRQRKEFVNNAVNQARQDLKDKRKDKDYETLVADRVKELLEGGPEDLREKAFGGNHLVATRLVGGGVQLRSHARDEDGPVQKPHLEPQQMFARTEGDEEVLPDQTLDQFDGTDLEEVSKTAPAPHTPDNMITKKPHEDGYSDLDKYGFTEDLDVEPQQQVEEPPKKGKKKEKVEETPEPAPEKDKGLVDRIYDSFKGKE